MRGCNRYLGNAQIEVPLTVLGLPLCAWITRHERRGGRSPVGPKGCQLEVGAQTFSGDICFDMVVSEKVRQE